MSSTFEFPRETPESQGVSSAAILDFIKETEETIHDLHSFMLLRHGAVVAEGWWAPYAANLPHMLFSLSKSYTSTAIGFAVEEGLLTVDDPVISFFPDDLPKEISKNLAAMKIRHLLSMSTGHTEDTTGALYQRRDGNWVKAFLARPVKKKPGTFFLYNTGATYMLSAILQKVTGMKLIDYLQPRLFEPLGIQGAEWEVCPRGINTGGFGLSVKTEDIARLGQLYLQKGMWQGKQIIPAAWIEEASSKQIDNGDCRPDSDWVQGYGYQFWRCRNNAYRGDGAFGQYCIVMPDQDAVLAITGGLSDMQAVLNLVWKHLLPAMHPTALPEVPDAQKQLAGKISSLFYAPPQAGSTSDLAKGISGKKILFAANEAKIRWVKFAFKKNSCTFTCQNNKKTHKIICGNGKWMLGETTFPYGKPGKVAASGTWTAPGTYEMTLRFFETPFVLTIRCTFEEERVLMNIKENVSFGPTDHPDLIGKIS